MNQATETKPVNRIKAIFLLHWKGKLPLAISYWVMGWLVQFVLAMALIFGFSALSRFTDATYFSLAAMVLSVCALTIWCSVGIWRSATYYSEASPKIWGQLAKVAVALGLIGFVLQIAPVLALIFRGGL
jgi:hypothetical protein